MSYAFTEFQCRSFEFATSREWMLANGLGGYAMGTISGINSRRYHGHLIAAIQPPAERMLLLAGIEASVQADGAPVFLSSNQYSGAVFPEGYLNLESFEVGEQSVRWTYRVGRVKVLKTLTIEHGANAVTIRYDNASDRTIQLTLRPLVAHRGHHGNFAEDPAYPNSLRFPSGLTQVEHEEVLLSIAHPGASRSPVQGWYFRFEHHREVERGLDARDDLFCPCELNYMLGPGESATLVASAGEPRAPVEPALDASRGTTLSALLRQSCDRFLIETPERTSIIAGYPWFTDWGRDTMIALPGVCLHTGRIDVARKILLDYAGQMNQGLIPNRFVESGEEPEYNTVDATLWFVHAAYKTMLAEEDPEFEATMAKALDEIYAWHIKGTHYGIKVDTKDGLLTQGEPGVQLTWMDAKIGDWVVTPRHGKPVEINGLWINALRVMEWLANKQGRTSEKYRKAAEKAERSFEAKFWCESRGHYFDTVDPNDASLRPNQLIAMALPFGPASGERALTALTLIEAELLTPYGLRTLGPREPGYKGQFKGPLPELDAAYHQGTVWPWLLGPYVTALVKLRGEKRDAKNLLREAREMLSEYGIGGVAEVYDGDPPQTPGGCPWQAWSAAELFRAWMEDAGGD